MKNLTIDYTKRGWVATKAKAKRLRKPRNYWAKWERGLTKLLVGKFIYFGGRGFTPKEARRLADWLIRAADWQEEKNGK